MIGLSCHGLNAIRSIDGLYENYVRGLGVDIERAIISLGPRIKFERLASDIMEEDSAFTGDRNFICAALARYLTDKYENQKQARSVSVKSSNGETDVETEMPEFLSHYHTRALFVDYDRKRVLVRQLESGNDMHLDYDLISGCDGIRSVVRNALASTNRNFEFPIKDTFGIGKAVHVNCPPEIKDGTFFFLLNAVPYMTSFTLPETNRKLNLNLGCSRNDVDKIDPVLKSNDVAAISAYFKKNFHAFTLDCDDAAKQWVAQGWNTISMVHCNTYHDSKRMILLMGDAAHATSPQIGQGMNTALADAAEFDKMLDMHDDDLAAALETFSKERVKEGNALTDLSFYTLSMNPLQQMSFMIRNIVRAKAHKLFPRLVSPYPMDEIPKGMKLSEAYDKMCDLGIIQAARKTNDTIMRDHFEKTCGMRTSTTNSSLSTSAIVFVAIVAIGLSFLSGVNVSNGKMMVQRLFCD